MAIGILGATVMPHNLYLHSSIVQTRNFDRTPAGKAEAIKFASIDSTFALMFALFINGGILILAAAAFHWSGHQGVADIQDAYKLLSPALGVGAASTLFAIALLASGQNSTLTGTLAGQIVMEGFLNIRIAPWLRAHDHAPHCRRARGLRHRHLWRGPDDGPDDLEPGHSVDAAQLRSHPAATFHQRPAQDGRVREPALDQTPRRSLSALAIVVLNCKLVFDFFAPKSLQDALHSPPPPPPPL